MLLGQWAQGCLCFRQGVSWDLNVWFTLVSSDSVLPVPRPRQQGACAAHSSDPGSFL